jgi:hypothetical protein
LRREHLIGAVDRLRLPFEDLLQFGAQVTQLVRIVLRLGRLIRGVDLLFAGVSRDTENDIGIERFWREIVLARHAGFFVPLAGFLRALTRLLFFQFSLPARVLFVLKRPLPPLFLFTVLLHALFLDFRLELVRAFYRGDPPRFRRFMPALLAQLATIRNIDAARFACASRAPSLLGHKHAAGRKEHGHDGDANPQTVRP